MHVTAIHVYREGEYGPSTDPKFPFRATVEVKGQYTKTEMKLSEELSNRVVAIIADEIANAGREIAKNMTAEAITGDFKPGDVIEYKGESNAPDVDPF